MPTAAFSIVNYIFDKVSIDFTKKPTNELSLSFETKGTFISIDSTYNLSFTLKICSREADISFIEIHCCGTFKFKNVENLEAIPDFFYNNSIAILFPYVRGYVSMITTQANIPGIILPTLNLFPLGEELKQNTLVE